MNDWNSNLDFVCIIADVKHRDKMMLISQILDFKISSFLISKSKKSDFFKIGIPRFILHNCKHWFNGSNSESGKTKGTSFGVNTSNYNKAIENVELYHWRCSSSLIAHALKPINDLNTARGLFIDAEDIINCRFIEKRKIIHASLVADFVICNGEVSGQLPNWLVAVIDVNVALPNEVAAANIVDSVDNNMVTWWRKQLTIALDQSQFNVKNLKPENYKIGCLHVIPEHYTIHFIRLLRHGFLQKPINGFQEDGPSWMLFNAVIKRKINLLIINGWGTKKAILFMLLARTVGLPYAVVSDTFSRSVSNNSFRVQLKTKLKARIRQQCLLGAACLLPAGTLQAEYMKKSIGDRRAVPKIVLFHFGIDTRRLQMQLKAIPYHIRMETRRQWGFSYDQVVVLFVGKLMECKGPDRLPNIASSVCSKSELVKFVAIGSGPLESDLNNAVINGAPLTLLGAKYGLDVAVALASSDIFCLPSREEQWGLAVNEALTAGLPVVLTNCAGSYIDLVEAGKAGIVCNNDDFELADAVLALADNVELRRELASNGKKHIEGWNIHAMFNSIVTVCSTVIKVD
jgi:glycosyltransferase involved in cell wall biosynthesis